MENTLCLKVSKLSGERAKRLLVKAGIFDSARCIASTGDSLLLPLLSEPSGHVLVQLSEIGLHELTSSELPKPQPPRQTLEKLLEGTLPEGLAKKLPKSFDILGDLILLEPVPADLNPHLLALGNALLKLNRSARTVLLKSGKVDGTFRVPSYSHVAGIDRRDTISTEHGVRLKIDVSKVYYSPRLGSERSRVASLVRDGESVVDMFAGVGPFSLLIAKRHRATVTSIDINPDAVALLKENIAMNKLKGEVVPILGDAREVSAGLAGTADRIIMNLPGTAAEYLGAAFGMLKAGGGIVHLYVFASGDPLPAARAILEEKAKPLGVPYSVEFVRVVKEVAPKEYQIAIDIRADGKY